MQKKPKKRNLANNYRNNNKERKDDEKIRMYYKDGNSTMLFCKMTFLAAKCLESYVMRYCENHNTKLIGKFIFAK